MKALRVRAKPVALRLKLFSQLPVVVDFAVEGECVAPVPGEHGLMTGWTRVNNRQPPVSQTGAPSFVIYGFRNPHAFIIAPAMLNLCEHPLDARSRINTDETCDSAHDLLESNIT
jgi:hypothetical protein